MALDHHLIRKTMRSKRAAIAYGAQKRASYRLCRKLESLNGYQSAKHIAFYTAVSGEISLKPLIQKAWKQSKHCYLPIVDNEKLYFIRFGPTSPMRPNRFGIPEPFAGRRLEPKALDWVFVPLVAFDSRAHRIGMGGGFYDRSFAYKKHLGHSARPLLVGVAHRCQQTQRIYPKPWDVPLDQCVSA